MIKRFESLRLQAYVCPAGKLTVGYGHTGRDVTPGLKITEGEANTLLERDINTFATGLEKQLGVLWADLSDQRKAVLVSFAFNFGLEAFNTSTLKKKIEAGDYAAVPEQLARWVYAVDRDNEGKIVKKTLITGLVRRREKEAAAWTQG